MDYKISKQDAKWLAMALGKSPYNPERKVVTVLTVTGGLRMAGATDGQRLHAIQVSEDMPAGAYALDKKTGTLTPVDLGDVRPCNWAAVAVPESEFVIDCMEPCAEKCIEHNGTTVYALEEKHNYFAPAKHIDQALAGGKEHKIRVQDRAARAVRIDITDDPDTIRFAFVLPVLLRTANR